MRHKWENAIKHYGGETSTCAHCGLKRIKRHSHGSHWVEWQKKNGEYIDSDKTPDCVKTVMYFEGEELEFK